MITLSEGEVGLWLTAQIKKTNGLWMHVVENAERATYLCEALHFWDPSRICINFPAWNCLPYDRLSPSKEVLAARVHALTTLHQRGKDTPLLWVVTPHSLLQKIIPHSPGGGSQTHTYQIGDVIPREAFCAQLECLGFCRQEIVREPGDYAIRGSLIDVFIGTSAHPLRLDFFGDTLEKIKVFDPLTQRTLEGVSSFSLSPLSELSLNGETRAAFCTQYRAAFPHLNCAQDPLYQAISQGRSYPGMEHWLPLFEGNLEPLWAVFHPSAISIETPAWALMDRLEAQIQDSYATRLSFFTRYSLASLPAPAVSRQLGLARDDEKIGYAPLPPDALYTSSTCAKAFLESAVKISISPPIVSQKVPDPTSKTLLSAWTIGGLERLKRFAEEHTRAYQTITSLSEFECLPARALGLAVLPLHQGFQTSSWVLYTEEDLFGQKTRSHTPHKRNAEKVLRELTVFERGDYVVHEDHGIGQYHGLEGVTVNGTVHDCLLLLYADGDKLYVPVENMNLISRYGSEAIQASLDKLGLPQWQARKARVKKRIQLAAVQLMKVAATRATEQGPTCETLTSSDFEAFCHRFPYVETEDQLRAIEETCHDLMGDSPMDRLVCGDVGFGKTEVALRAAFLSASSGYQVALVVPTTLLARQHFQTFQKRFEGTPFRVAQISRLVSRKEVEQVTTDLKQGRVHIVIATHALLRREMMFHNLGLLIVDEEQHFGVAQKEKLKSLKPNVHVLTLSATPIPRTLQMALTGVREMSLITTPPSDRLAVQTFLLPFDPVVIREAILREHARGGQIFYVCPRLEQLEKMKTKLTALVPEIRLDVAHGQMSSTQLENVMERFEQGAFDLLLSTNIVESGIDIATANTLIVHRSDLLGLAQLYQLRGRVGRGRVQGYAYFTFPAEGLISPTAQRRLDVIQSLDYLGAGFAVASHDADIRGVGNLVGEEQSGHIREVGVELYQQMLQEAVEDLKHTQQDGTPPLKTWTPQIHFPVSLRLPETYIPDLNLRLGLYRTLSDLKSQEEVEAFEAELIDRFGPFPQDVKNLLQLMTLKILCQKAWIEKLDIGEKGAVVTFYKNTFPHPEHLLNLLSQGTFPCRLSPDHKLRFLAATQTAPGLKNLQGFLEALGAC